MDINKDICTGYDRNSIHQIEKKDSPNSIKYNIYPLTYIQAVYDASNGDRLDTILEQYNSVYVYWKGSAEKTRLALPRRMRRKGVIITYRNSNDEVITEKNINDDCIADDVWGLDAYWVRITDALPISGNVTIGNNGNWFVDGEDTGFKAQGPKGENGLPLQPRLSEDKTKIEFTYNGEDWYELFPLNLITPTINFEEPLELEPGSTPTVENIGDDFNVNLQFGLPKAPEVNVGTTITLGAGNKAKVSNSGTKYTPILNFSIPMGNTGPQGPKGDTTTIKGRYDTEELLKAAFPSGDDNNAYLVGTVSPYQLYLYLNEEWVSVGTINEVKAGVFDGGRADTKYGGARTIDCGTSNTIV